MSGHAEAGDSISLRHSVYPHVCVHMLSSRPDQNRESIRSLLTRFHLFNSSFSSVFNSFNSNVMRAITLHNSKKRTKRRDKKKERKNECISITLRLTTCFNSQLSAFFLSFVHVGINYKFLSCDCTSITKSTSLIACQKKMLFNWSQKWKWDRRATKVSFA